MSSLHVTRFVRALALGVPSARSASLAAVATLAAGAVTLPSVCAHAQEPPPGSPGACPERAPAPGSACPTAMRQQCSYNEDRYTTAVCSCGPNAAGARVWSCTRRHDVPMRGPLPPPDLALA